jgi:hypothetical protein
MEPRLANGNEMFGARRETKAKQVNMASDRIGIKVAETKKGRADGARSVGRTNGVVLIGRRLLKVTSGRRETSKIPR